MREASSQPEKKVEGLLGTVSKDRKEFPAKAEGFRLFSLRIVMGALIAACTSLAVACVPFFPITRPTDGAGSLAGGSGKLIRPTISHDRSKGVKPAKHGSAQQEPSVDEEFTDIPGSAAGSSERETTRGDDAAGRRNRDASSTTPEKRLSSSSGIATDSHKSGSSDSRTGKEHKAERSPSAEELKSVEARFRKPDHKKYAQRIRNEAINVLNMKGPCDLARLCRDDMTEEWNLTLYRKREKSFVYVVYAWDPVDGKFELSFESAPRPLKGWKRHHKFAVISKHCSILKGRLE